MSATYYKRPHVDIFFCIEMGRERNQGIKKKHPVFQEQKISASKFSMPVKHIGQLFQCLGFKVLILPLFLQKFKHLINIRCKYTTKLIIIIIMIIITMTMMGQFNKFLSLNKVFILSINHNNTCHCCRKDNIN